MKTYGFNIDKIEKVWEIESELKKLYLKMMLRMNELGVKTKKQELDEKWHNLAVRGVNENRT